jgi:muramidase (phage lysozyme)
MAQNADRVAGSYATQNVTAFLHAIRRCEGTDDDDGYHALFGYPAPGRRFDDYSTHPNRRFAFRQTDGTINATTAAGAYQFIYPTWDRLRRKLKLPDFTPSSQDRAAMELIAEAGAMGDVKRGDIFEAMNKCADTWASLPNARFPQPKRSVAFALAAFLDSGGKLA